VCAAAETLGKMATGISESLRLETKRQMHQVADAMSNDPTRDLDVAVAFQTAITNIRGHYSS